MIMHKSNFAIEVVYDARWYDTVKVIVHPSELNYQPHTSSTKPHAFCFENLVIALTRLLQDKYYAEEIYSIRLVACYGPETLEDHLHSNYTFEPLLYARAHYEKTTTWAVFYGEHVEFQGTEQECHAYRQEIKMNGTSEWEDYEIAPLKPFYKHPRPPFLGKY